MPRRGRRSEGAKKRWRRLDLQSAPSGDTKPGASQTTSRVWSPTLSPEVKVSRLLESVSPDEVSSSATVYHEEPRATLTFLRSGWGTGHRHRVKQWPRSDVTGLSHKLVLPAEAPEKKFALLVGDSHLRAIVDGFVAMPEGKFSFGFLATPGASAAQLRREVQKAVLPRTPEVVCLLAPSNNLTASRTPEEAGVDFDQLLVTICNRWPNVVVVDFPPRLVVEESLQHLLRLEYRRVAARRSVRYLSVTENFPLSRLELWSKDGVHLSDHPGMEVLAELLWVAAYTQLDASEPKSPAPVAASSPPVRRSPPPRLVVVGEVASPRPSNPFEWTLVRGGQKQQVLDDDTCSHTSRRMVDQQGGLVDSSIPPNPVWFSPSLLEEMDRIFPASGCDSVEPTCSPRGKKKSTVERRPTPVPSKDTLEEQQMEGTLTEKTRPTHHQPRRAVPTTEVGAPAESSSFLLEGSSQDSALEPSVNSPPIRSVRATLSQADRKYGSFSRNHQCACMALTFLAYHNEGLQFDTVLLDRVLDKGDELYVGTKRQLILDGTFSNDHLTVEEMPRQVMTDRNIYTVHTTGIRVGYVFRQNDSPQRSRRLGLDLASQLECLSENVTHAFLLVTPEFIAVFRDRDGRFGVFDSHSRNSAGLPHPNGTAIMKTFSNLTLMVEHLHKLFQNRGPRATYEFVPVGFVNDFDDAPSPILDSVKISQGPTEAGPGVQKPESPSEEDEMPPWLCDVANTLEDTVPTLPDVSKMPKARRQKVKQRIQAQLGHNVSRKLKQSTFEKVRYDTCPTFKLGKLQALKQTYVLQQAQRKDQITRRYKNDAAFRRRQINYVKKRYSTEHTFRTTRKTYMGRHLREKYNKDPSFRSQKREYIRNRYWNNPIYRSRQKKYVTEQYRNNPTYRNRQKKYIKVKYADPIFRARQQKLMSKYMKEKYHTNSDFRVEHIKKCSINKKVRLSREDVSKYQKLQCALRIRRKYRNNLGFYPKTRQYRITPEMKNAIQKFQEKIRQGPTYVCTVCHRALFPSQVKHCNRGKYTKNMKVVADCLTGSYVHVCGSACSAPCSVPEERMQEWICYTCDNHLFRGGMPPIAAANGLHLAPIPPELAELNVLERQLIAKIIPFAKIVSLPKGQQKAVHGAVVCVPSEMETTVNSLPRPSTEAQLLQVKLKRKIKFKGHQYFYTVNMDNVLAALAKLKQTHPDYRDVTVNESAVFHFQGDEPTEESIPELDNNLDAETEQQNDSATMEQQPNHIGEEHQALRPGLILDTCMQPPDLAQEVLSYGDGIFSIAPAQGNKPVAFFSVPRLESKAYPVQFPTGENTLDQARAVKLSPSMYFNVRLFSVDTRFAADQSYLFFAQFVTETHMANNSMSIQTRKGKGTTKDGRNISSKMLQDKEELETLIHNKEATRFMQPLRGTPAYWEKGLRDLHAMVRQLGKPTFFVTFSAAEMRWPEFIEAIKAQHGEQVEFSELDWNAKCDILRSNPVTVMRMFEKRVDALFTDLILSSAQPLGPVEDYFYRVEFQARGSPHIHAVIWIKDAPEMEDPAWCDGVVNFIDRYISCQLPDETTDPELHKIVKEVQMHSKKHSKSCKKGNVECRFGFPKLPMESTRITVPQIDLDLENDEEKGKQGKQQEGKKKSKKSRSRVISKLQREAKRKLKPVRDLLMDEKSSFKDLSELLRACKMTKEEYNYHVDALTSGMVVMMKRDPKDSWVNGYNPDLLRAWNANMDIQYVLDEYSCIEYMMSYIAKPEHEMAQFLKSVVEDLKTANINQQDEMKKIMQAYSKQREVSAQESVARTCSLPLKKSSRSVIFIQTDEDGVKMSLPMSKLMNMGPDEEDVWMKGLPEKYINRPQTVEFVNMCLAEFVSEYRVLYGQQIEGPNAIPLLNDAGYIQKRTVGKPAVIRFTRFSEKKQREKFYRRLLKLYLPHRRDEDLKSDEHSTYEAFYRNGHHGSWRVQQWVDFNRKRYEGQGKKIDKIMEGMKKQGPVRNAWNTFAPEVELERLECVAERPLVEQDEDEEQDPVPDYQMDVNSVPLPAIEVPKLSPDFVRKMCRSLNETQASIFYAIRHWCLQRVWGQNPEPFFYFLTGGAGCGKSHVIKCVYQEATKLLRQLPRFRDVGDMSHPTVLLTAFTGTAAYNISGKTLHSILKLPKSLKPPYKGLGNSLDDLRAVLSNVEILIIDEISMVSKELLAYVHWRFQQIKGNTRPFGGISVLAVGDFLQLPPMGGSKPLCVTEDGVLDLWNENFCLVSLTEIMRQKDDKVFAELLNRLRIKRKADMLSEEDRTLLTQSVADPKDCPLDVLHIFATNKQVDTHNAAVVASLDTAIVDVHAEDYRRDKKTGNMVSLASSVGGKKRDLRDNIQVGFGIRVMITRNLDVEDGLVNGTFGTIADIVTATKDGRVTVKLIGLKLDNSTAGRTKRMKGKPDNLVYIERFEEQTTIRGVVRRQFPLKLAFGCTAHKVQGMTMQAAVVSLKRIFEPGMAYVALSRTTSLEGLKIIDFDEKKIYADENTRTAMDTMRPASFLNSSPLLHFQSVNQGATLTIIHHNIEGLMCHYEDMKHHHELGLADVLCLTETHLFGSSCPASCHMEGYCLFTRNRHVSYSGRADIATKEGGGVATYCRSILQPEERRYFHNVTDLEYNVIKVNAPISVLIATVYRPPSYDLSSFLKNMQCFLDGLNSIDIQPVLVLGDFNEDLLSPGKKAIKLLFETKGYTQLISAPTTEKRTLIDHIYISRPEYCVQSGVLQTYYSYHNPVYCILASFSAAASP